MSTDSRNGPAPSDCRADTRAPRPTETYVPPRNAVLEVIYGNRQHNETPVGMFASSQRRARPAKPPSEMHLFVTENRTRNCLSGKTMSRRGPIYGMVQKALEEHGPLGLAALVEILEEHPEANRRRVSDVLAQLKRSGEVAQETPRGRWVAR